MRAFGASTSIISEGIKDVKTVLDYNGCDVMGTHLYV